MRREQFAIGLVMAIIFAGAAIALIINIVTE